MPPGPTGSPKQPARHKTVATEIGQRRERIVAEKGPEGYRHAWKESGIRISHVRARRLMAPLVPFITFPRVPSQPVMAQ